MTHRSHTRRTAPTEPDTRGRIIFDAVCAPIVIALAIAIVAHVFDKVSPAAGLYARWALYAADALWGAGMLWVRLRRLRRNSLTSQHQTER